MYVFYIFKTIGSLPFLFVFCKRKMGIVFLGQQTINGNQHFLCQQTFLSKVLELYNFPQPPETQIHMICLWNNIGVSPLMMYWWFSLSKFEKSPRVWIFVFQLAPNFRRKLHIAKIFSPKFQKVFKLSRPTLDLLSCPLLLCLYGEYWFCLSRDVYDRIRSFTPILRQSRWSLLVWCLLTRIDDVVY